MTDVHNTYGLLSAVEALRFLLWWEALILPVLGAVIFQSKFRQLLCVISIHDICMACENF